MNTREERFTRRDLLLLLLLGGLVALFFWRIWTPNTADRAQFPPGDFTDQFYAFRLEEARSFAAGQLPLWSEHFNSGHPFLADIQAAVFYPVGLANTLLNVALTGPNFSLWSLELEALLHFWLAGAFTYLFARRLIGGRAGPFLAALVFTFGGYLTSYPPLQLAILETATWLPLALLFLHRASERDRASVPDLIAAGVTLGVAALAGHPQTFLFVLAVCATYWFYRSWSASIPLARGAAFLAIPLIVAFGLAAVQLVPSIEYQRLSTREALSFRDAAAGFPTLDLLQFLFPGFTSAFASPLYVGVLPLWLAVVSLVRRDRERLFWALLALAALILSFGYYVFAYAVLYQIPGVGLFRDQERLAFVVSFSLALLAGFGLEDLLHRDLGSTLRRLYLFLPAGAVLSFVLLLVFFVAGVEQSNGRIAFLGDRAGLMLLLFGLTSAGVAAILLRRLSLTLTTMLAVALVLFDLWSVNEPANKASPEDRYASNPVVEAIQQDDGLYRVAAQGQGLPGHWGIGYQLEEIGGISPLRLAHYDEVLGLDPATAYRLLSVKYVYSADQPVPNAERVQVGDGAPLYRLNDPSPRAWIVARAETNLSDAQALAELAHGADTRVVALLAGSLPFPISPDAQTGRVRVTAHAAERIALDANLPADGLVILSENDYPGWTARVDGAPVEIMRADLTLRGVPVRAGPHQIEMTFEPRSLQLGAILSALTILACAALAFGRRVIGK